jgi:fructokinase
MIPVAGPNGEPAFSPLSGGAIFNTSIALGRLEVPVGLLSGISNDLLGEQLVDELVGSHVSPDLLIRSNRPTTLAFVKLTNGHAEYTFYDENSAGRLIEISDLPEISETISTLYFGGISLCAEPAASTYEALFLREATKRVTMIDPNIRTSFIADEAGYRKRLNRMISVADIVKVSDEDLDWIIADGDDIEAKVETLHQLGAKVVIVTKGGDGPFAYVAGAKVVHVGVPKVTVVDTVGAGDTFNAGFLAALANAECLSKSAIGDINSEELKLALEFAVRVAAVTVSRAGANPPTLKELEK